MSNATQQIADDVLLMRFPWRAFGIDFNRNVTLLRLTDARVAIHTTAKFTSDDLNSIRRFGQPTWLVEASVMHDTFAKEGRAALPNVPYLAPEGFTQASGVPTTSLVPPPADWAGEIDVLKIEGTRMNEHVLFHRRSRTLVVADLFFSFPEEISGWPRFFVHHFMRLPRMFGISLFFRRLVIFDQQAFRRSMKTMLEWDFDRLIVGHWKPIETGAKQLVEQALAETA